MNPVIAKKNIIILSQKNLDTKHLDVDYRGKFLVRTSNIGKFYRWIRNVLHGVDKKIYNTTFESFKISKQNVSDDNKDNVEKIRNKYENITGKTDRNSIKTKNVAKIVMSRNEIDSGIKQSFTDFITKELETEIFPMYDKHEKGFDEARIHGRMHVGRAIIFCEVMARYHHLKGDAVDFNYVRRVTGLHDAGRKANGEDLWEEDSADILFNHLKSKGMKSDEAYKKSRIIMKQKNATSLEYQIFQSADCLDIMRPCTGRGGKAGFDVQFLSFLKNSPSESEFRGDLIDEAWKFIQLTENEKFTINNSEGFMKELFKVIESNPNDFKILSTIL